MIVPAGIPDEGCMYSLNDMPFQPARAQATAMDGAAKATFLLESPAKSVCEFFAPKMISTIEDSPLGQKGRHFLK